MNEAFSVQVGRWCDQAGSRAREAFIGTAWLAVNRVKELTPVDTGWLRSNWQAVPAASALPVEGTRPGETRFKGAQELTGQIAGGLAGSLGGAKAGAAVGTLFGGPLGGAIGALAGGVAGGVAGDAAGSAVAGPKAPDVRPLTEAVLGDKILIVNPVRYAAAVEYGRDIQRKDGSVTRVPGRHMMQQTIAEMPRLAAEAVRLVTGSG